MKDPDTGRLNFGMQKFLIKQWQKESWDIFDATQYTVYGETFEERKAWALGEFSVTGSSNPWEWYMWVFVLHYPRWFTEILFHLDEDKDNLV